MRITTTLAMACMALSATAQVTLDKALGYVKDHFTLSAYAQVGWDYNSESHPSNEFTVRRIIVMADYRLNDHWNAFLMTDFKGMTMHEYWVCYTAKPWLRVKLGQFKTPFTIENPISPSVMEMISQLSAPTSWMIGGSSPLMMPGGVGRDLGLSILGDVGQYVSYDVAVMNGAGRNRGDDNSCKDFVGRIAVHALPCLDIGGSLILGRGARATAAEYFGLPADATGNYTRNRYATGFRLNTKPINLRGEWMWGKDANLHSNGGYATTQINNVGVDGLDIVASADYLSTHGGDFKQTRYQAGVQYWFWKKCRVQVGYMFTDMHDTGNNSHSLLTQVQVGF